MFRNLSLFSCSVHCIRTEMRNILMFTSKEQRLCVYLIYVVLTARKVQSCKRRFRVAALKCALWVCRCTEHDIYQHCILYSLFIAKHKPCQLIVYFPCFLKKINKPPMNISCKRYANIPTLNNDDFVGKQCCFCNNTFNSVSMMPVACMYSKALESRSCNDAWCCK